MSSAFAAHFGINNIPYGVASSSKRPTPQCVTRIENDVIFLTELSSKGILDGITDYEGLGKIFYEGSLNAFAALPKDIHARVRSAIQATYREARGKLNECVEHIDNVQMHLPVQIGDFSDFSGSINHMGNMSEVITGKRTIGPMFHKFPPVYAGRSSSIYTSGTPVTRPLGQSFEDFTAPEKGIIFGPCQILDYELEVGAIIGRPVEPGSMLHAKDADERIFGVVLVNDWSARDIQVCEMTPLGPFNGKNFATTISPWIITLEALKPYEVPAPTRSVGVTEFLDDPNSANYKIDLEVEVIRNGRSTKVCNVNFDTMHWTLRQMLAHHTIGGCGLRTGDLIATGTVSGVGEKEHGCLMELTKGGRKPFALTDGSELSFLEDGDIVQFTGALDDGVGFGECIGQVRPASKYSRSN
ncbi:fumarylacetoacetate hydrolase FahA [Lophiostoma macrostomum CBS 122681]|uniref:Fumarylacetoacetase n=1 Tax=Lophiostoma macrostomum CBS 122681 TaxID=1314788 RepID=A0A6A6SM97_9PLEO|nr:fumarylacetoacetate hydrolase FahA [Lophiostoma macrostomum CBS 122681]